MDLEIDGNAALITASSSGLGRAAAEVLAREGADVILNGRREEKLKQAVQDIEKKARGEVRGVAADLTEPDDIEMLVERTIEEYGRLDHLVTSAGGPPSGSFVDMEDEDWYEAFDMLVMSVVRLVRRSLPYLERDGGGTIVNLTSRSVKEALNDLVLSNSVRMSVIGLMKTLSQELGPDIRVNAVLPGPHKTDRIEELIKSGVEEGRFASYEEGLKAFSQEIPLRRLGSPQELGETVAFLSSPKSSYINGTALLVDGGGSSSNL